MPRRGCAIGASSADVRSKRHAFEHRQRGVLQAVAKQELLTTRKLLDDGNPRKHPARVPE
jgi:hypothetical protein